MDPKWNPGCGNQASLPTSDRLQKCALMLPRHFSRLDETLAVGSYPPGPEAIAALAEAGVQAVVNLQSDPDLHGRGLDWNRMWMTYTAAGIRVTRVPIIDFDIQDLARRLSDAVAAVAKQVDAGRMTYVHCNAGLNRSPTTVIGFLVRHRGLSVDDAVSWVQERHECVPYSQVVERWSLP